MSRFPFTSYPNGWFVIAFSSELARGAVLLRHYFGQDIVLYRTEDGVARASKPHCPHLGAHLGYGGKVIGQTLRCPFHGWTFGLDGKCVAVPQLDRPPRTAIQLWHLREVNNLIFVYHHSEGAAPDWEVPQLDEETWSPDMTVKWTAASHPQEILENTVDTTHLSVLHGIHNGRFIHEPVEDGPVLRLSVGSAGYEDPDAPTSEEGPEIQSDITLHGLGIGVIFNDRGDRSRQRLYAVPIDMEHIDLRVVVNVNADMPAEMAQGLFQTFVTIFTSDLVVLEHKRYVERPPVTQAERHILTYRKWAQRFYSPVAAPNATLSAGPASTRPGIS